MKKRQWAIIGGLMIIGGGLLLQNYLAEAEEESLPTTSRSAISIKVKTLKPQSLPIVIPIDGPIESTRRVELFSEVTGAMKKTGKTFEEGIFFGAGEALLSIDDEEAHSTYQNARSRYLNMLIQVLPDVKLDYPEFYQSWQTYLKRLVDQEDGLEAPPAARGQFKLFLIGRGVYPAYQEAEAARIRLAKYTLYAPFDGILTEALVDPGALIRVGQPLGQFIANTSFEMTATIADEQLSLISMGDSAELFTSNGSGPFTARISRINPRLESNSLRARIYLSLESNQALAEGQYLRGRLYTKEVDNAYRLPRRLIIEGNKVYTAADSSLALTELEIIHNSPQEVIVKSELPYLRLPENPVAGAYPGMPINVLQP
jgi:multidrug efflux pump subunit AcrA (membrane-fusion protein)